MATGATPFEYFYVQSLTGGLNTKDSPLELRDNELQEALNVVITSSGAISKRPGYVADSASEISGATTVNNVCRFYPYGVGMTIAAAIYPPHTKIYSYSSSNYTEITGGTDFDSAKVRFKDYKNWLFMWDGVHWEATTDGVTKADVVFNVVDGSYMTTKTNIRLMEICDNRIFVVFDDEPNTVFFSEYGGFNTSPVADGLLFLKASYFNISEPTNDQVGITTLKVYSNNDELLIFRENDTWVLLGVGSTDYILRKFRGEAGCVSYDGVAEDDEGNLYAVGNARMFKISGDSMLSIGDKVMSMFQYSVLRDAAITYDALRNLIYVSHPNGTLVWNVSRTAFDQQPLMAWTFWDVKMACAVRFRSSYDSNRFFFYKANDTKLYELTGTSDAGEPIDWAINTKLFDFTRFAEKKLFGHGVKTLQNTSKQFPFTVSLYLDNNRKVASRVLELPSSGSLWGSSTWAGTTWAGANRMNGSVILGQGLNGYEFSVKISGSDTSAITLYKIAVEFMARNRDRDTLAEVT